MRKLSALFILCTAATCCAAPVHLRTNALDSPLGVDTPKPIFSWRSDATRANWMQSAYQILVATGSANLKSGKADVWDPGRISSSESVNIVYAGSALQPQQRHPMIVREWGA